jgi:hypothetical protein
LNEQDDDMEQAKNLTNEQKNEIISENFTSMDDLIQKHNLADEYKCMLEEVKSGL